MGNANGLARIYTGSLCDVMLSPLRVEGEGNACHPQGCSEVHHLYVTGGLSQECLSIICRGGVSQSDAKVCLRVPLLNLPYPLSFQ